jgi:hypothetical protein
MRNIIQDLLTEEEKQQAEDLVAQLETVLSISCLH